MFRDYRRGLDACVLWLVLWMSAGGACLAQQATAPAELAQPAAPTAAELPPPLTHYQGREIAQTMHYLGAPWLVRESRQREEDCDTMFAELRLMPGMTVCDMGCGNGFYTLRMAEAVSPSGTVYAVDIQPEMLRLLEARADEGGITNIKSVLGTLVDPRLPPNSLDLILCVDVYHEFSHPEQMLAAMRRALKPRGQVVLLEFREEDPEVPIKPLHKMSKAQILKEWIPNGFRLSGQFDQLPWQHMMFFQRDERPQP
jgi:2-polyprenyl-3-methyl-5-hydroxy-6-metoxy-1,4-benzoquinol methylase